MTQKTVSSSQTRRDFLKAVGAGASSLALLSCRRGGSGSGPGGRPNILWITCEDISPALGCYGDAEAYTPNLDRLASEGVTFKRAFSSAPICAPARSCLITGMDANSLGTPHLRSEIPRSNAVPCLPELLREQGYYCTNNSKTDYNFSPEGVWDENGTNAHWRNRPSGKPFFSVFNITVTHEGNANGDSEDMFESLSRRHDPARANLPPYFPDTPEMRRIWARYYDLVSVMDERAGEILDQLETDGLAGDTVVFFFSDHGFGLPRYKRWPYDTGLHVPLIVRIPAVWRSRSLADPGTETDRLAGFADFAPTVLSLAGVTVPPSMQGLPFLGTDVKQGAGVVFGSRDRADDVYDLSRTVRDRRYRYIRNYMPHLPYIQDALIFSEEKTSFRELRRIRKQGLLPAAGEAMFAPKPIEELYDLEQDPEERINLAASPEHRGVLERFRSLLRDHILGIRDTGFLHESEMMIRSGGGSPYDMAADPARYDLPRILDAAEKTGDASIPIVDLTGALRDTDSGVRFWAVQALIARGGEMQSAAPALLETLADPSPCVRIACAEALCRIGKCEKALPVLAAALEDDRPWVALQAATAVRLTGEKATPILPVVKKVLAGCLGTASGRYRNWSYPMFIGFALDQVLIHCGEDPASVKQAF
ncbi:sulfatase-like hydrolase/transferase [bacterium]|nr:sulfatase-like hydrolase/transferase [bacterium]